MTFLSFRRKRDDSDDPAALDAEVDTVLRVLANYPPGAVLSFGAPVRCPLCSNFGLVEEVDRVAGRTFNRCPSCTNTWVMSVRAMRAARPLVDRATTVEPRLADVPMPTLPRSRHHAEVAPGAELPAGVLFSRTPSGTVERQAVSSFNRPILTPATAESGLFVPRTEPMRILLVEDDPDDIDVVRAILEPVSAGIDLRTARTRAAGEEASLADAPDLVLLDLGLPDSHGMATVTRWHYNAGEAPVLVVSGGYAAEIADRGRELGISGFLDKAELADLLAAGDEGSNEFLERLTAAASS